MTIIFFAHPLFLEHQSMPRFARMLADGMQNRGHKVELWLPQPLFFKLSGSPRIRKWLGYFDQYVVFPREVRSRLPNCPANTLFVFTDHALGPWVPLVADRPHVIHCHDFLAQRSALGEIKENLTSSSGRQYQAFIRRGYSAGKNFISVSQNTKTDLHQFLAKPPLVSEVVYNGLNQTFAPQNFTAARNALSQQTGIDLTKGFLLHVGGNQWYKNRSGIMQIYHAWRMSSKLELPLLLVGEAPSANLLQMQAQSLFKANIHFLSGLEDKFVRMAYAGASVFLFPSLAEGFGWPIAEAMASGCPVITTNEAPMTEVAGNAGFLIPRCPRHETEVKAWATNAAQVMERVLQLSAEERKAVIEAGFENAKRFNAELALNQIETIYRSILQLNKDS